VIVNAFVGGMIGLERTIIPQIAEADFGMAAKTAILSFIVVFGVTGQLQIIKISIGGNEKIFDPIVSYFLFTS
jgi:hypothetical protein